VAWKSSSGVTSVGKYNASRGSAGGWISRSIVDVFVGGVLCTRVFERHARGLLNEKQTGSKFTITAFLRSDAMVNALRKEVRRLSGLKLEPDFLLTLLEAEIIKRELIDSDDANSAVSYVKKLQKTFDKEHAVDDAAPPVSNPLTAPKPPELRLKVKGK
jgi:hypothetical protein